MSRIRFPLAYSFFACAVLLLGTLWLLQKEPSLVCIAKRQQVDMFVENSRQCEQDSDCTLFVRACGPYATCGLAIRRDQLHILTAHIEAYATTCSQQATCLSCEASEVFCNQGRCDASQALTKAQYRFVAVNCSW